MKNQTTSLSLVACALLVSCAGAPPDSTAHPLAAIPGAAPAVGAPPPALDPPKLRLPDDAVPTRYEAELTLDPAKETFHGVISIHLTARRATRIVWLHAEELAIHEASFTQSGAPVAVDVRASAAPFVALVLPADLAQEQSGVLRIDYEGKIDGARPQGIYAASEGTGPDDRYIYSTFEPLDARRAFPCFDEPGYKVPWKLSIRVRKGHTAFANTEAVSTVDEGATTRISFAETPPLPSYLVAFMAGPFEAVEAGTVGREKKRLRFLVPRGRGAETRYAAEVTPAIIGRLEDYFGMPYPYSKLDVAVVPRFEGTMEHPGIVALGQPLTLIKPEDEGQSRKQAYANTAAHELSHYWFGDYVTMKWWDDTWLNESFAEWMDAKITDEVSPAWRFGQVGLLRASSAMRADSLASARKMRQPVASPEDILNAFDGDLTYNKGASLISMMEHAITPAVWQKVVRRYMEKHAWKTTASGDFTAALAEVGGADAAASFETFLNQPGVPLITVAPVCDGASRKLRISQQRFLPLGTTAQAGLWSVPVCVRYGAGAEKGRLCTFLGEKVKEVPIPDLAACPAWIVPNEAGAGYYVSAYTGEAIERFKGPFGAGFTSSERAALARDVGFLVASGSVPLGKALELVPAVVSAADPITLEALQSILGNVHVADLPEPLQVRYRSFARKTFGPRARALGLVPKPGEDADTVTLREVFLRGAGSTGGDPDLLKQARILADRWLADRRSLGADSVGSVLSLAARGGDGAFFERILGEAKKAGNRSDRSRLVAALGRFEDPAFAERSLGLLLSGEVELRDAWSLIYPLLSRSPTREIAYGFIEKNFDALLKQSTGFEQPQLFQLPEVFCDGAHRARAEAFFGPRAKKVDGAERVLANALESVALCDASRKAALPSLEEFLNKY